MSPTTVSPYRLPEWWLMVLLPLIAIGAGASMVHVASTMGFTALGEPVTAHVTAAPPVDGH